MRVSMANLVLACFLTGSFASLAQAQASLPLLPDRVEEDWELVIATPDMVGAGPQITTAMSPVADATSPFVALDLNYREYPAFVAGGMQVQVWSDKMLLGTATQATEQCNTPGEKLTWTQRMSLASGTVTYAVVNGTSTTWGKFGQGYGLLNVTFDSTLASLAAYSPDLSAANSGVSWESNLVTSMKIVQVRYYSNGVVIATDSKTRSVRLD